jgi:exo-1,4-beta-D-glucosaminidase
MSTPRRVFHRHHTILAVFWAIFLSLPCLGIAAERTVLPLEQGWWLQTSAKLEEGGDVLSKPGFAPEGWYATNVPVTVLAALADNKVYPDPYFGVNLKSVPGYQDGPWLVMKEGSPFRDPWWYRTEFQAPADFAGKFLTLHLEGINYKANVWLNGKQIATSDTTVGMFRRFVFDVTGLIKPGEANAIAVEIVPPGLLPPKDYDTKQLEATTGWDDHNPQPPDGNMGIWQPVYVVATGAVRLEHAYVANKLELPSMASAKLTVSVDAVNASDKAVKATVSGTIEDRNFSQEVALGPKERKTVVFTPEAFEKLVIANPRVWWPNLTGKQEMYALSLQASIDGVVSDAEGTPFGIRDFSSALNEEDWRAYKVNGKNILIRGGAWMTSDMLLRLTAKRYDALVRYASNGNLNMLRSEGFSIRELEDFYNACDRYGVMVTQQIFGRNIPDEPLAIACIEDMLLRIRNHPSLVHFLGHDETFPTESLDKAYKDMIAKYCPDRTYQPHSGAFSIDERVKTGGTRTGSREVWTYATPGHYYVSEKTGAWGFAQSGGIGGIVAPASSIRRMMPESELWPLWTESWSFHTVIQGGTYFDAVLKAIDRRYGVPEDFDDFCRKAYAANYESARGMYEAYGRNKHKATGITTWKYDVAWPAAMTWAYVDWYLNTTAAYYGAQKACEPVHIQYSYDDKSVVAVNGTYERVEGLRAEATIYNFDLSVKAKQDASVALEPDSSTRLFTLSTPADLTKTYFVRLLLRKDDATVTENFYWLSTTPDTPGTMGTKRPERVFYIEPSSTMDMTDLNSLPPAKVKVSSTVADDGAERVVKVTAENIGDTLAFQVRLSLTPGDGGPEVCPAFWSENMLNLLPGESRMATVRCYTADLDGKVPTVEAEGWNVK